MDAADADGRTAEGVAGFGVCARDSTFCCCSCMAEAAVVVGTGSSSSSSSSYVSIAK